jgi:hypothetical protein
MHAFPVGLWALLLILVLGGNVGLAQDSLPTDTTLKSFQIVRTSTPPTIDGVLDDAVWSSAAVVSDFQQSSPIEGAEPTERTEIYLLFDDDAIYIAGRFWDSEPDQIAAGTLRHRTSRLGDDDRIAVVLSPYNDRRSGYKFETNANGVKHEAIYQNVTRNLSDWDTIWNAASSLFDEGWMMEMAIPFKSLSFDPQSDTWGVNFSRAVRRKGEEITWISRNQSYNPSVVGLAVGFENLDQGVGLDVVPSISLNRRRTFDPTSSTSDSRPSLNVFYKVTPSLNAALTLNTDFSATEVDTRQVNLTRFNLFFPEKRGFFLQDTDIFEFGGIGGGFSSVVTDTATSRGSRENGRPFFSRRVGLNAASGRPVDLNYGGKLSGRIGRWSVGALTVEQDNSEGLNSSDLFVGRASASVMEESAIGLIVTDGDPNADVDNSLIGVDFRYLNTRLANSRVVEADAWLQQSDTAGLHGKDRAYGLALRMPNRTGPRGAIGIKEVEENFNPALGFINRTGIRDMTADIGYTHFFRDSYLRSIRTGVDLQRIDKLDGGLQSQVISVRVAELVNGSRDSLSARFRANKEVLVTPFLIHRSPGNQAQQVVIAPGNYSFDEYRLQLSTASQRRLAGSLTYQSGDFYNGDRVNINGSITWRPSKFFTFNLSYDWNEVDLPQGDFTTRLVALRAEIPFSNRFSWVNFIQYDNVTETAGIDSRLHWVQRDGREAFLVLTHNLQDLDRDNSFQSQQSGLALKVNYTFRF